jgi:hypothetical protein
MVQQTSRELALVLLRQLIDLELEQIAMARVLGICQNAEGHEPPDWREMVLRFRNDEILRDRVAAKYADTERLLLAATSDCPNALSLLVSVLRKGTLDHDSCAPFSCASLRLPYLTSR